jgi:hypothetical protein
MGMIKSLLNRLYLLYVWVLFKLVKPDGGQPDGGQPDGGQPDGGQTVASQPDGGYILYGLTITQGWD